MNTPIHFDGHAAFTALLAKHRSAQSALRAELASFKGQPVSDRSREIRAELPALSELITDCLETLEELALEAAESDANCCPTGAAARNASDRATHNAFYGIEDAAPKPAAKPAERAQVCELALDADGEAHTFAGFLCTILENFAPTQAGFDCKIALEATPAQLEALGMADPELFEFTAAGLPIIEANAWDQLTPLTEDHWEFLKDLAA